MQLSRRALLASAPALLFAAREKLAGVTIGVTDWNLRQTGKLEAVALARSLGFDAVEVSLGRTPVDGKLPMDNSELQARYVAEAKKQNIALAGTCLDILHVNYLKNDKLGQKWVAEGIPITKALGTRVMLLPFFGKGAITAREEQDYVAGVLKELAPEAEKAGVVLALENTISAEDNARILDFVNSTAVRVYYDVGNSTNAGFDPVKEIRWLGKARICQIHLKDRGYLGEGKIDFPAVMKAIDEIGYSGYAILETSSPSGSVENDMKKNLAYIRKLIADIRKS
ncbi:MAG: sugar phosphate isomerase/epimerase family protein [Rhodospirillales bacterium]